MSVNSIISIIIALIVFGIVVLVHEFGHFIVAIKSGILVEEFAIGMGPAIFKKQKGDTLYSVRLLPLGGYCKMLGEDEANNDKRAFNNKSVFVRFAVIAAGAIMNFILALVIVTFLSSISGFHTLKIKDISDPSPALSAGLKPNDQIIKLNNKKVRVFEDINLILMDSKNKTIDLQVKRDNQKVNLTITPVSSEGRYMMGVTTYAKQGVFGKNIDGLEKASFLETMDRAFWTFIYDIKVVFFGLKSLVTLNVSIDDMAGPVGIVNVIGDTYKQTSKIGFFSTFTTMATLAALISANLGVFNLLPIPALDGGRLLFLIIEAIRKKPVSPEKEGTVHFIGFAVLMVFIVVITFNDISRIFF